MVWDLEQAKEQAYKIVQASYEQEKQVTKKDKVQQTINLAVDELDEVIQEFEKFLDNVDHLIIHNEMFKETIVSLFKQLSDNARYFLEKNYSKEEINEMPEDVYQQVANGQKRRKEILQKIANKYFL